MCSSAGVLENREMAFPNAVSLLLHLLQLKCNMAGAQCDFLVCFPSVLVVVTSPSDTAGGTRLFFMTHNEFAGGQVVKASFDGKAEAADCAKCSWALCVTKSCCSRAATHCRKLQCFWIDLGKTMAIRRHKRNDRICGIKQNEGGCSPIDLCLSQTS